MPQTLFLIKLQRCLHVNFAKFLRTPFLQNTFGRLLLYIYLKSELFFKRVFIGTFLFRHPLKVDNGVSISTTLYLQYLSAWNKMFGPLKFPPRTLHSLSLFRTSLSRTFPNKFSGPLKHFLSLSPTSTYLNFIFELPNKFEFESK